MIFKRSCTLLEILYLQFEYKMLFTNSKYFVQLEIKTKIGDDKGPQLVLYFWPKKSTVQESSLQFSLVVCK